MIWLESINETDAVIIDFITTLPMRLIKKLIELSNTKGIIALENSRNKRVLLIRSSDILVSLSRVLKEIKTRNKRYRLLYKDYRKIDIKVLTNDNSRLSFTQWTNYYSSLGYTFYHSYNAVKYSIKIDVDPMYQVVVKLVSKAKYEVIVGYFDTISDADNFVSRNYPDRNNVLEIKYAENEKSMRLRKK